MTGTATPVAPKGRVMMGYNSIRNASVSGVRGWRSTTMIGTQGLEEPTDQPPAAPPPGKPEAPK